MKKVVNYLIYIGIFLIGFIVSMLYVKSLTPTINGQDMEGVVKAFGIPIYGYTINNINTTEINVAISKYPIYKWIPFIAGIILVIVTAIINCFVKKWVNKNSL